MGWDGMGWDGMGWDVCMYVCTYVNKWINQLTYYHKPLPAPLSNSIL